MHSLQRTCFPKKSNCLAFLIRFNRGGVKWNLQLHRRDILCLNIVNDGRTAFSCIKGNSCNLHQFKLVTASFYESYVVICVTPSDSTISHLSRTECKTIRQQLFGISRLQIELKEPTRSFLLHLVSDPRQLQSLLRVTYRNVKFQQFLIRQRSTRGNKILSLGG